MKTLKFFFFGLVCASLLAGCSKSDWPGDELVNEDLKAASADGTIILVGQPSGGDDTEAFKAAFELAKLAGAGAVVLMDAGEYHLRFIEVYDFCGSFRGAGKDQTIITVMNHMDGQAVLDRNMLVDLVKFVGGDVLLSNFTLQTPEGKLTDTGLPAGNIKCLVALTTGNAGYEFNAKNMFKQQVTLKKFIDQFILVSR